jgi:hypothetical protein
MLIIGISQHHFIQVQPGLFALHLHGEFLRQIDGAVIVSQNSAQDGEDRH